MQFYVFNVIFIYLFSFFRYLVCYVRYDILSCSPHVVWLIYNKGLEVKRARIPTTYVPPPRLYLMLWNRTLLGMSLKLLGWWWRILHSHVVSQNRNGIKAKSFVNSDLKKKKDLFSFVKSCNPAGKQILALLK